MREIVGKAGHALLKVSWLLQEELVDWYLEPQMSLERGPPVVSDVTMQVHGLVLQPQGQTKQCVLSP
jgi:hypothetical protein